MDLSMHVDYKPYYTTMEHSSVPEVKATLENGNLWRDLYKNTNEMIINKPGRCMFPKFEFQLHDLNPQAIYNIFLEMLPVDDYRYKYGDETGWVPSGKTERVSYNNSYLHPESGNNGAHFMSNKVVFNIKFTNMDSPATTKEARFKLNSMQKYIPRITLEIITTYAYKVQKTIQFRETEFIAVTAYQNSRINDIKTDHNKFARGFRPEGKGQSKRKNNRNGNSSSVRDDSSSIEGSNPSSSPCDLSDQSSPVREHSQAGSLSPVNARVSPAMIRQGSPREEIAPGLGLPRLLQYPFYRPICLYPCQSQVPLYSPNYLNLSYQSPPSRNAPCVPLYQHHPYVPRLPHYEHERNASGFAPVIAQRERTHTDFSIKTLLGIKDETKTTPDTER